MNTIVVNLFGTPGAGKSTGAAYIFAGLKLAGINAELVSEFAKDKVWEEAKAPFENQAYIFGQQYFRISRVLGKVDIVITDSPILLSVFYNHNPILGEDFNKTVLNVHNSMNTINYLLTRTKEYNPIGRFQTEEESDALLQPMKDLLFKYDINCFIAEGNELTYNTIINKLIFQITGHNKFDL